MDTTMLPLYGIKVIELGTHVAVPIAARMMASWGADVIKIERPGGDAWRQQGTSFHTPVDDLENPIFMIPNSNKQFLSLDIKTPQAKKILLDLIRDADVFMSSVRLPALKRLGLDYESLQAINPKIIYFNFTSLGSCGKESGKAGLDTASFWGRTGALLDWVTPDSFPAKPFPGMGDSCSGSLILNAILTALLGRERTGKGTMITSSLLGSAIWYNAFGVISTQDAYGDRYPKSEYESVTPFAHPYRCSDGEWLFLCVIDYDRQREKMFRILGLTEYLTDERFLDIERAHKHIEELIKLINARFFTKTSDEWASILDAEDCVYQRLMHTKDVAKDLQAWENGYLSDLTFPNGHHAVVPKIPIYFSAYETLDYTIPGPIGRDTDQILTSMGYTLSEVTQMREAKIIK